MKKLINDPKDVVAESVAGFARAHGDLVRLHPDPLYVVRADAPRPGKVGLVSGGGSAHEPLHAGFVGPGMLDAAVPGAVFTSPTPDAIVPATAAVDGGAGVVHIVKNYTGDVLNFRIAGEISGDDQVETEIVLVDDDLATETEDGGGPGRRGTAATVIVEKVCGAAAEEGQDLAAVAEVLGTLSVRVGARRTHEVGTPSAVAAT